MEQQVIIVVSEVEQEVIIKNKTITAVTNEQNFTATRWFACSKTMKRCIKTDNTLAPRPS